MCRLYGFRANEETKVECSLVHAQNAMLLQSRADLGGRSHPDGWGIAFYHNAHPDVERRATAAFEDLHFSETAERIYTKTVLAHIRLATVGKPSVVNAHPFSFERWAFAHNGTVRGFDQLRCELISETDPQLQSECRGATDSEQVFFWLLSRMAKEGLHWSDPCRDLRALSKIVANSVAQLSDRCAEFDRDRPAKLNFLLTDGRVLVAARWNNSLHLLIRDEVRDCEICGIPHVHHQTGVKYRAIVIASEPITHENWSPVPDFHVLTVDEKLDVDIRPIRSDTTTRATSPLSST